MFGWAGLNRVLPNASNTIHDLHCEEYVCNTQSRGSPPYIFWRYWYSQRQEKCRTPDRCWSCAICSPLRACDECGEVLSAELFCSDTSKPMRGHRSGLQALSSLCLLRLLCRCAILCSRGRKTRASPALSYTHFLLYTLFRISHISHWSPLDSATRAV